MTSVLQIRVQDEGQIPDGDVGVGDEPAIRVDAEGGSMPLASLGFDLNESRCGLAGLDDLDAR